MQERISETMFKALTNVFKKKATEDLQFKDVEFEAIGFQLKEKVDRVFGRSLAIRELEEGNDKTTEIEHSNLTTTIYDVEHF